MTDDSPVSLQSHNPAWLEHFEEEGVVLLEALQDAVRDIAHVGATAVPDLPARPIIDIMVGVDTLESVSRHVVPLQQIGYEYLGEAGVSDRLLFRKRDDRAFDLTVVLHGGEHWQRKIRVRDFLRNNPEAREEFAERKRQLAADADSLEAYEESLTDQLDAMNRRAQ